MKKILILFLALSVVGGAAFAQSFTVGAELNFDPLTGYNDDGTDDLGTHIRPFFSVSAEDVGGHGIDVSAEVGVNFFMMDGDMATDLDFEFDFAYNLPLSPEGTLTFGLNFTSATYLTDTPSALSPRVVYTHDLGGMTFFGGLELGIAFTTADGWPGNELGDNLWMDLSAGMTMAMDPGTLGFDVTLEMSLQEGSESADDTVQWLSLLPNFTFADLPLYVELEVRIPLMSDGMDDEGISLIPEVRYGVSDALEVWLNMPMRHVTGDPDLRLGLGLGVQFSF